MAIFTEIEQNVIDNASRILRSKTTLDAPITSADLASNLFKMHLATKQHECFAVAFLNNQHGLIEFDASFYNGTFNACAVYIAPILSKALKLGSAAIIVGHNHPSGKPEPSQADIEITRRLQTACQVVEISLLDHFVIGNDDYVSFAQRGLL